MRSREPRQPKQNGASTFSFADRAGRLFVVEIDGKQHQESTAEDEGRDSALQASGVDRDADSRR